MLPCNDELHGDTGVASARAVRTTTVSRGRKCACMHSQHHHSKPSQRLATVSIATVRIATVSIAVVSIATVSKGMVGVVTWGRACMHSITSSSTTLLERIITVCVSGRGWG